TGNAMPATLFAAAVLLTPVLMRRCLLLGSAALTAGRRPIGALVLVRRRLLLSSALTAGRRLIGTLVLLRRSLLARTALARRGATLARRRTTLGADLVRQSER